jgi:ribose transport system substrate-binding protein
MNPVTQFDGPTQPFKPPTGKRIMILSCGSAGQGCPLEAKAVQQAAELLGWKVDMVDGKLDPTVWNQTVKQEVDSGVDGIIAIAADPNLYTDAMAAVRAKEVPFVLTFQRPKAGDVEGVNTYVGWDPIKGGKDVGDWMIADSGGKTNPLVLNLTGYTDSVALSDTIANTVGSDCKDCKVYRADIAVQTLGTSLAPLVTSQLQQHPDVNYVWAADDCCASFVAQGIQQAGKSSSVKLVSVAGLPDQLARIKSGQVAADLSTAYGYSAWLDVDSLGRAMAGQPVQQYWPIPQRLWTTGNIDQATPQMIQSGWDAEFDYQSNFKKLWGLQ